VVIVGRAERLERGIARSIRRSSGIGERLAAP
jgi:hypothetical protein